MKYILLLVLVIFPELVGAVPIECSKQDGNLVIIKMETPHPREALVHRPSGVTVWLQNEGTLAHRQIKNFENLQEWSINSKTIGTVYRDGKPFVEPVLGEKGVYHLYVAENTETERENTYFIECYFEIT